MLDTTSTTVLPPGLEAPAVARTFVAAHATNLPPELVDDALLCVSELVSNAVLHGLPDITLQLRTDPPGIGVAVTDLGPDLPTTVGDAPPPPTDTHGRGLQIVAALSHAWGVSAGTDRKTIWFELIP